MLKGYPCEAIEVLHPTAGKVFVLRQDLDKFGFKLEIIPQIKASILGVDVTFSPNTQDQAATRVDDGYKLTINGKDVCFNLNELRDKKHPKHKATIDYYRYVEGVTD